MLDTTSSAPDIRGLYIDGAWHQTSRMFEDINPSDGSVWARILTRGARDAGRD